MTPIIKLLATAVLLLAIQLNSWCSTHRYKKQTLKWRPRRTRVIDSLPKPSLPAKTQDSITTADNAAELKKAEAEKLFADARAAEEVAAANAKGRQAAEAQIAVQKAEQEYQAAQNAERRAGAEADKMEADALTAKRFGDTAI